MTLAMESHAVEALWALAIGMWAVVSLAGSLYVLSVLARMAWRDWDEFRNRYL